MTKIYALNKGAQPFNNPFGIDYLNSNGIKYTNNPLMADVILASSPSINKAKWAKRILGFKKFIYWSNEPRFNTCFSGFEKKGAITMNVYSKNVFLHNLHFLGSYHYDFGNNLGIKLEAPYQKLLTLQSLQEKKKFCAAFFVFKNPKESELIIDGEDISLNDKRQTLAEYFYSKQKADVFGSGWPTHIKIQETSGFDSGEEKWWDRKLEILKDYKYNICFENTVYPNYCTEKIWHAISAGCLPIYYGKNGSIYNTFPKGSFVDAADFDNHDELLNFLEQLPSEEHIRRYNLCLKVMLDSCKKRLDDPKMKTDIIDEFIAAVRRLKSF